MTERPSTCWPGVNLDGFTEIYNPSPLLQAFWKAELIDTTGVPAKTILPVAETFDVRFRIELVGPAWRCMCGDWKFDVCFDEQCGPGDFRLASKLAGDPLTLKDWKGCDPDGKCIEFEYTVPAGTITASVYELTGTFQLYCCDKPAAIVGYDPLGVFQWYV